MTLFSADAKIPDMVRAGLMLFLVCVLGAAASPVHAQTGDQAPSGDWTYYPPSPQESVEIGNFYLHRNDAPGALSRFEEAVHDDPHYAPAYLGLGKVYEKMGKRREALSAYQRYLQELPSDRSAAKAKSVHRAIARLERELAQSPAQGGKPAAAHK